MSFPKIRITAAGKVMVAEALDPTSPKTIKFTKFKVGGGTASSDETQWDSLTDLIQPKLNVTINEDGYSRSGDLVTLAGEFSNTSVQTAFFWTELGIYAVQVDSSDNEGPETLMFYGNAGGLAEYVPASDAEVSVTHRWSTKLVISSAADVSAVVHSITYATAADLNAHIQDQTNPHGTTYDQVGAAPKSHRSTTDEYGAGNGNYFGHVRLSSNVTSDSGENDGIAATPEAVHIVSAKAQAALTAANSAIASLSLRGFPAVYGTYRGNGSIENGVTLTFSYGVPKVIFIILNTSSIRSIEQTIGVIFPQARIGFSVYNPSNNGGSYHDLIVTAGSNIVKFSHASSTANGMNWDGHTYSYVAIM